MTGVPAADPDQAAHSGHTGNAQSRLTAFRRTALWWAALWRAALPRPPLDWVTAGRVLLGFIFVPAGPPPPAPPHSTSPPGPPPLLFPGYRRLPCEVAP